MLKIHPIQNVPTYYILHNSHANYAGLSKALGRCLGGREVARTITYYKHWRSTVRIPSVRSSMLWKRGKESPSEERDHVEVLSYVYRSIDPLVEAYVQEVMSSNPSSGYWTVNFQEHLLTNWIDIPTSRPKINKRTDVNIWKHWSSSKT